MDRLIIRIHGKDEQSGAYPITAYSGTQDSKGIPNAASFRNPLIKRELGDLQGYVEEWRRKSEDKRPAAVTIAGSMTGWGEKLFDAIFKDSVRGIHEAHCNEYNAPPPRYDRQRT